MRRCFGRLDGSIRALRKVRFRNETRKVFPNPGGIGKDLNSEAATAQNKDNTGKLLYLGLLKRKQLKRKIWLNAVPALHLAIYI